jgi:pyruvate dehydrogenase E2 component (dihydrolipoamide acetyltransferase)
MTERAFELPDVGEGLAEGEIVRWLVEPGDAVSEDQPVVAVETDKAVVEVPSPVNGTVGEIHAEPGDVVPVGEVIVTFEGDDADGETGTVEADAGREAGAGAADAPGTDESAAAGSEPATVPDDAARTHGVATTGAPTMSSEPAERDLTLATPRTRGVAHDLGVDLDAVPTDRAHDGVPLVTAEAVRKYAAAREAAGAAAVGDPDTAAVAEGADERIERVPYRGIRRTIGERMERSKYTAPHVTHQDSVEVSQLVETRALLDDRLGEAVDPTFLPFVVKAVVAALAEYPYLNASLDEENEEILLKNHYDVGVATATEDGLIVPVVDEADRKGLGRLAEEIADLVAAARDRSIAPEALRGGTFTVTNVGAIGGDHGTSIINYPEVAILAVGTVEERPVVVDGDVVARPVMPLSLTVDHRVVDGAVAARFTNRLTEYLHDPRRLLVE